MLFRRIQRIEDALSRNGTPVVGGNSHTDQILHRLFERKEATLSKLAARAFLIETQLKSINECINTSMAGFQEDKDAEDQILLLSQLETRRKKLEKDLAEIEEEILKVL